MKVNQVGALPDRKAPIPAGTVRTDWAGLASALKSNPGKAVLVDEFTQTPRVTSISSSLKRTPLPLPLRDLGGTIECHVRNSTTGPDGVMTGDIWVTYTPKED